MEEEKSRADTPCSCALVWQLAVRILQAPVVYTEREAGTQLAYLAVFLTIKFLYSGLASQIKREVLIATLEEYIQSQQTTFLPLFVVLSTDTTAEHPQLTY